MTGAGFKTGNAAFEGEQLSALALAARSNAESLRELVAKLAEPRWNVRREVVAALAGLGEIAVASLCSSLRDDRRDETRIAATIDTLVAAGGDVESALFALAEAADAMLRADIAQILGRRRNPRSVAALIELLNSADDNVAVAAIEALGRVGGRAAVDALVAAVGSDHFFRTYPAIDVLGRSGDPRAVAPLSQLLSKSQYVLEATRALGRTGDKAAVRPLCELLASPADIHVRVAALALAELLDRHSELYGSAASVREALHQQVPDAAVRRISQVLTTADAAECAAICTVLGASQNQAAAPILARLVNGAPAVAAAAAKALVRLGRDAAAGPLREALARGDSARRLAMLPLFPKSGDANSVLCCLDDSDPAVRAMACDVLARIGDTSVVALLFEHLNESNARVAQAALSAIQSLGSHENATLALEAARSPSPLVRRAALRILSYFGSSAAIDPFEAAVRDGDARVRDVAIVGLALIEHPRARDLLLQCAGETNERTRAAAMRGLGQTLADDAVIAALTRGLTDSDAWVRYYACQAIGKLRVVDDIPSIAGLLEDSAGQVRVAAVETLSHAKSQAAFGALRNAAASSEPDIQRAALIGLGLVQSPAALPVLIDACGTADAATRLVALSALSGSPSAESLVVAVRALRDHDEGVRAAALGVLASWPDREATTALVELLRDEAQRARVARALATDAPGRTEGLLEALSTADDELAPVITSVLARLDPHDESGALLGALQLQNVAARKAVAAMLAARGSREAIAALSRQSTIDPSEEVRRVCALLLVQC